jgi:hypothetical protein
MDRNGWEAVAGAGVDRWGEHAGPASAAWAAREDARRGIVQDLAVATRARQAAAPVFACAGARTFRHPQNEKDLFHNSLVKSKSNLASTPSVPERSSSHNKRRNLRRRGKDSTTPKASCVILFQCRAKSAASASASAAPCRTRPAAAPPRQVAPPVQPPACPPPLGSATPRGQRPRHQVPHRGLRGGGGQGGRECARCGRCRSPRRGPRRKTAEGQRPSTCARSAMLHPRSFAGP